MRRIRAIVAVDSNLAIGAEGGLPWHYPDDLRFFRQTTTGHAVLMGRRTFASIGRPLPGRTNLVLSASGFRADGVICVASVEEALATALPEGQDLFVIGGAAVYRAMAPYVDEWLLTRIPVVAGNADTFLPENVLDGFTLARRERAGDLVVDVLRRA